MLSLLSNTQALALCIRLHLTPWGWTVWAVIQAADVGIFNLNLTRDIGFLEHPYLSNIL